MVRKLFQRFGFDHLLEIEAQRQEVATTGFRYWAELDVLRGMAAVSMIVNHLGNKILYPEQLNHGLTSNLVFVGSFAPVLFFFITGVGYGLQAKKTLKTNHWAIVINKVAILIVADLFMHWSNSRWLGLDFFGFIAISCIVLEVIKSLQQPIIYALVGLLMISGLRYGIGPHLTINDSSVYGGAFLGWVIGTFSPEGISYPLSPWIAYPLLGYIVGRAAAQYSDRIKKWWLQISLCLFLLAIFPLASGMILAHKVSPFFRWGTVSLSYYIVSFTAILVALSTAILICRVHLFKISKNTLALPGVASFAIVPIHYFLIYLTDTITLGKLNSLSFYGIAMITLVVSFLIAKIVNQFGHYSQVICHQRLAYYGLVGIAIFSGIVVLAINQENLGLTMLARTLGQTTLCLLFAIRRS
jgi:uncharacterized membrane protein